MKWDSWSAFFAMGGYAEYVWGSYVVTAACFVLEIWALAMRRRAARGELRRQIKAEREA